MGSLLRSVKKRKKSRRLGEVEMVRHEDYGELALDAKVEMIRSLVPLGLMHVHELLDDEVKALAGERYSRKDELERGRRHGSNPGTVGLGGQRVPIRVPRVRSIEGGEIPLRCYEAVSHGGEVNDLLLKRVLYGISCRNYEAAAEAIPGAIGLSSSTVSRGFVQASGLDPVSWTLSERRIRCPQWQRQRSPGDPAGSLMTSLRQARSGWCLMRARAWVGWPGSLTSPNRRFATGSVRPGPIGRRAGRA